MMKALAVIALLCGLYAGHVRWSPLVYQDANLIHGAELPFSWDGLLHTRGLSGNSWRLIQSPQASHALNLTLHLAVVGLVGLLFWRLTHDRFTTWAITLITAFHPLTGETVAYASARAEMMAAIGVLVALLCVTSHLSWVRLGVLPSLALAVAGKETGIVAVGLIPLVLWYQGRTRAASLTTLIAACAAVSVLPWKGHWAAMGEYDGLSTTPAIWIGVQSVALWRLVVLSVAPLWLSVSPEIPMSGWAFSAALVLLAGSLETAWRARVVAPLLTLGIVGCALVAAPRFLVRTPTSPFNEHQWYLAMPFVTCVLTAGLHTMSQCLTWLSPKPFLTNYGEPS